MQLLSLSILFTSKIYIHLTNFVNHYVILSLIIIFNLNCQLSEAIS